jgi:glycosyltransferase involved in cell wall biosynthesis
VPWHLDVFLIIDEHVSGSGCESISVVLPAFNEAENIGALLIEAGRMLSSLERTWEIIVVDDGSDDGTAKVVEEATDRDSRVTLVQHPVNLGYGAALRSGFFEARHDLIFFTDTDSQFELKDLEFLLANIVDCDLVAGVRSPRRDPLHRCLLGWVWTRSMDLVYGVQLRDLNCAFKLIRRRALCSLELHSTGAFINAEIVLGMRARGFKIQEHPVRHRPRPSGQQSGARLSVIVSALWEAYQYGKPYPSSSAGPRMSAWRKASLAKTSR